MKLKDPERRDIPFRRYGVRQGAAVIWAKQMPEAFTIRVAKGTVDQTKVGAKPPVEHVCELEGKAGDYLAIPDVGTGERWVIPRTAFKKRFEPYRPKKAAPSRWRPRIIPDGHS